MRALLILGLAVSVAGCPQLDAISGNEAPSREAYEYRQSVLMAEVEAVPEVVAAPDPECYDHVFRIYRCIDGKIKDWYYE